MSWQARNDDKFRELVLTFWFVKPEDTLVYISNEVKIIPINHTLSREYEIDNNTKYEQLLSTLGQFANDVNNKSAIEIALDYLERDYSKIKEVSKMLIDNYGYNIYSFKQGYQIQKILIDTIIERMIEYKEVLVQLFCNLSSHLLSYNVKWTESTNNKSFVIHMISLYNFGKMEEIRSIVWQKCHDLISKEKLAKYVISLLSKYVNNRRESDDKTLYELDFSMIRKNIISSIDINNFNNCSIFFKVNSRYKRILNKSFPELEVTEAYQIYKLFKEKPYDYSEDRDDGKQKLEEKQANFARNLSVSDYGKFIEHCREINQLNENNYSNAEVLIRIMFNVQSFIEMVEIYIEANAPFDVQPPIIIKRLIDEIGYDKSFDLVLRHTFEKKEYWEYLLYSYADHSFVSQKLYTELILYFEDNDVVSTGYYRSLVFLEHYKSFNQRIYCNVIKIILEKEDEFIKKIYLHRLFKDEEQTDKLIIEFNKEINLLERVYLYVFEHNEIYDPNGLICRKLIAINNDLIFKIIDILCSNNSDYYHDNDIFDYTIFWEYEVVKILELIEYIIEKHTEFVFESKLEPFFISRKIEKYKDKIDQVIEELINRYSNSQDRMNQLFYIIANYDEDTRIKYYTKFVEVNNDIEAFQRLPFNKRVESWSGSEVPRLTKKKEFINKLLDQFIGVKFLRHRSYLKAIIKSYDESIRKTRIREFLRDY